MNSYDRQQNILKLIHQNGKVTVKELSRYFGTSEVTIRTDLAEMESKGFLSRVHGGAVSNHKTYYNMDMEERINVNQEAKKRIAETVSSMLADNSTVMFGAGTTSLYVFRMIPLNLHLNVVTNYIPLAVEAGANPNLNVVLVGGQVNYKYQFTYGDDTMRELRRYHADTLILSVHGVSSFAGLTTYFNYEAGVCRVMMEQAEKNIIVADSSKIGRIAFAKLADIGDVDHIVTNNDPEKETEIDSVRSLAKDLILI